MKNRKFFTTQISFSKGKIVAIFSFVKKTGSSKLAKPSSTTIPSQK